MYINVPQQVFSRNTIKFKETIQSIRKNVTIKQIEFTRKVINVMTDEEW